MPVLTGQSGIQLSASIGEVVEDFFEDVIDVLLVIPEGFMEVAQAFSPEWNTPSVFNDEDRYYVDNDTRADHLEPCPSTDPDAAPEDFNVGIKFIDDHVYAPPNYSVFEGPLQPDAAEIDAHYTIEGGDISFNTFAILLAVLLSAVASYFGFRGAAALVKVIISRFFGVSLKEINNNIEDLREWLEATLGPIVDGTAVPGSEDMSKMANEVSSIMEMLKLADGEISGLISALRHGRLESLNSVSWTVPSPMD